MIREESAWNSQGKQAVVNASACLEWVLNAVMSTRINNIATFFSELLHTRTICMAARRLARLYECNMNEVYVTTTVRNMKNIWTTIAHASSP